MDGREPQPDDQSDLLGFIGDAGQPSDLCKLLEAPFISGSPTKEDIEALLAEIPACRYCTLVYATFMQQSGDEA